MDIISIGEIILPFDGEFGAQSATRELDDGVSCVPMRSRFIYRDDKQLTQSSQNSSTHPHTLHYGVPSKSALVSLQLVWLLSALSSRSSSPSSCPTLLPLVPQTPTSNGQPSSADAHTARATPWTAQKTEVATSILSSPLSQAHGLCQTTMTTAARKTSSQARVTEI